MDTDENVIDVIINALEYNQSQGIKYVSLSPREVLTSTVDDDKGRDTYPLHLDPSKKDLPWYQNDDNNIFIHMFPFRKKCNTEWYIHTKFRKDDNINNDIIIMKTCHYAKVICDVYIFFIYLSLIGNMRANDCNTISECSGKKKK